MGVWLLQQVVGQMGNRQEESVVEDPTEWYRQMELRE